MSDIGILSTLDLYVLAFVAGLPGLVVGAIAGVLLWRGRPIPGLLLGSAAGFALCLGGVLLWVLVLR